MDIKEISKDALLRKYKVTIPQKDVSSAEENKAKDIAKTAKIPGFRVGKVPLNMVKARYEHEIKSALVNSFVESGVNKIMKENDFDLAEKPIIQSLDFKDTKELVFEVEFQLLPKMPEIDFSKIKLTKYTAKPSDKDLKDALVNLQKNNAELQSIKEKDIQVKKGHVVLLDADASMDGKNFPEGTLRDYKLKIGSKNFIDGFEEGLVGVKVNDQKTLNLKFPDTYHAQKYAGKDVTFVVKIKEIFKEDLPKIDDEFAKKFKLKNLSELREMAYKTIQKRLDQSSEVILKKELFDKLNDDIKVDLPEKLLKQELEFVTKSQQQEDRRDNSIEDSTNKNKSSDKNKKAQYEKIAQRRVKLGLLMNAMIKKWKLSLSQQDLSDKFIEQLRGDPKSAELLTKYYKENPKALDSLKGQILEDKVVSRILSDTTIQEKNVTPEELKILHSKTS